MQKCLLQEVTVIVASRMVIFFNMSVVLSHYWLHQNHLEILLKHKLLGSPCFPTPSPKLFDSVGLEDSPRICVSIKCLHHVQVPEDHTLRTNAHVKLSGEFANADE